MSTRSGGKKPTRPFGLSWPQFIGEALRHLFSIALCVTMLLPFIWMISTSLKDLRDVFSFPPQWIPNPAIWNNYLRIWDVVPFARYFLNSAIMVAGIMVGQLVLCTLAAYAFSRVRFRGRNVLFLLVLAMMMVPVQVRIIPMYLITMYLGLLDTYAALIVPNIFNAFAIFLLRQFFLTLPRDMDEAAVIDGANHIQILTKVIVPLSRAVFSALTVFIFLGAWNSLLWPLIATSSESMRVVAVGLTSFGDLYGTDWPLLMTGSILVVMPTIIMYLVNQQFITRGIVMTGIKG
jgi:multiple sugar transport system permease protein